MCIETIEIKKIRNSREAYEIAEYMKGVPHVDDARCNFLRNTIEVDYDETKMSHADVLDELEYAGCKPAERRSGMVSRMVSTLV